MRPLFITAHYDDLEVSAGGTAARYGGTSVVLYPKPTKGTRKEAEAAAAILGIDLRSTLYHSVDTLTRMAESHDIIISVSPWDSHPDHQAAASIARQVARKNKTRLWFMDHSIPGGYGQGPRPRHFVDTTADSKRKRLALECYNVLDAADLAAVDARDIYYGRIHGIIRAEGFTVEHSMQ